MSKQKLKKWENKFKLWISLHGGLSNIEDKDICSLCPHYLHRQVIYCEMYGRQRLAVNKKLDKITYKILHDDDYDWLCAEWVRYV
jgi:hypothetical protein